MANSSDASSFQVQDADAPLGTPIEQTADSNTPCHSNPSYPLKDLRILTSDGEEFTVQKELAERSTLIMKKLQDVNDIDPIISLPNVTATVLQKVIEWCEHHSSDPIAIVEDTNRFTYTEMDEWDQQFVQVDQEMLCDIILAAYHLDIKGLLDVGTKTVANMIKGKTAKEIRTIFNISNDFTAEEEAQIRKENEWREDRTDMT